MSKTTETALKVKSLDFLKELNGKLHHTSDYLTPALTVRRGQSFKLRLNLNRELSPQDPMVIQLSVGDQPLKAKETLLQLPVLQNSEAGGWGATVSSSSQTQCEVDVRTSPNAIVGKYTLKVKVGDDYTYQPQPSHFYLLFNPWCEGDDVYLPNEDARCEYVLKDVGYIYVGHSREIVGRPWNFGQFEEEVLEVVMALLDKSELAQTARRDPVRLARTMSALVNSNDDRGVLMGNWSGKYPEGTSPLKWTGSSAILQQYGSQGTPVKYGQCWVFSGVLTTVMRCLGIPARSVTNFSSAHDTDQNLTIDVYVNQEGKKLDRITTDSIWNFHVWNDAWMKRRDLAAAEGSKDTVKSGAVDLPPSESYDGWQTIDATPQEMSGGVYQCGPCPVKAIKEGQVYLPYDGRFIFAEVNGDRVIWLVESEEKDPVRVKEEHSAVGKRISTKAVLRDEREDITLQYKYPEGSEQERKAMETASAICSAAGPCAENENLLVELKCSLPATLGSPVLFSVCVSSLGQIPLSVTLIVAAQLQTYNGKTTATVKTLKQEVQIAAMETTTIPVEIETAEYMPKLSEVNDNQLLLITAIAVCNDPRSISAQEAVISFAYPSITVALPEVAKLGEKFTGTFTFKNTTGVPMDNCKLLVEGLGLFKLATFDQGNIAVGRIFRSEIQCRPYRTGKRKIIAKIISNQISGITAEGVVDIVE